MRQLGKKGLAWASTRRELKTKFEEMGITRCEARLSTHCGGSNYLGFAHRYKRRFITTQEELETVALVCNYCHDKLELLPHEEMKELVDLLIEGREDSWRPM